MERPQDTEHQTAQLEVSRGRQEMSMRWILLATVVVSVVLANLSAVLYGPPPLPWAIVQATWVGLLSWIVRRLFGPAAGAVSPDSRP